jgi:hypothetical protein
MAFAVLGYWVAWSLGMGQKGCYALAVVTFALMRLVMEKAFRSASTAGVASMQQRLGSEQLPTQPGTAAGAAAAVGMPASIRMRQEPVFAWIAWLLSLVLWAPRWFGMLLGFGLCLLLGFLLGTQRYVHIQAAERKVRYLAWVLHFWWLAMWITVLAWMLRLWLWTQHPVTDLLFFAVVLCNLLPQGSKACADLQDKCSDHMGNKLSVASAVCFDQGFTLAVGGVMPFLDIMWSGVVDATVGAWVVCIIVHSKQPWRL